METLPEEHRDPALFRMAAEGVRLAAVAGAGVLAMAPFLRDAVLGGGDAKWYSTVVADVVEQWRMGFGPAFVGQTRFGAIGTVTPLRLAPYLQHFTVAIDMATGRRLSPYLLLNLAVFLSGVGVGLSAYLCLCSVLPRRRWEALLLSLLYLLGPAVVGMAYYGQLFMSVMALPFLPLAFCGVAGVFHRDAFTGWAMAAAGCAGCWLAHPPIGLWASASVGAALGLRWACGLGWTRRDFVRAAGAALLFAALCGYVFVSFLTLDPPESTHVSKPALLAVVRAAFPASLSPVSPIASQFSDLQLGWSLWALLLGCGVLAWTTGSRPGRVLAAVGLLLVCLALPVPWLNAALWRAVPQSVVDATNEVPMQRLYPVIAALAVTLAACALPAAPRRRGWILAGLALATAWSGFEIRPFVHRGRLITNTKATSENALGPDSLIMTRFSLGMLSSMNAFYSDGAMDFELEQRVLAADRRSYIVTNVGAIAPGLDFGPWNARPPLPGIFTASSRPGERTFVDILPRLTLRPGQRYLLEMDVPNDGRQGILQIQATGFYRDYSLPKSGGKYAFGSAPASSRVIPLSTASKVPLEVALAFINQDPVADLTRLRTFAHYRLVAYDPSALPLRLVSILPYVARVSTPAAGWYESFRYFTPGWSASVNGKAVPVRSSMNGLVSVPVGPGESEIRLLYRPPAPLLASYGIAWASWAAMLAVAAWRAARGGFSWADPSRAPTVDAA